VAVIDTGVDYNHPDLAANIWTNPGEIPDNGIDDDNNGYIDDVRGWDWVNDDNDPFDDHGHGTHTSGTVGAIGDNGIGVAGVNWNVSLVGLKFLSAGGTGSTEDAVSAVEYATMMGFDLTSNSWGGGGFSQALYDAIQAAGAADQLFVAAAGNGGTNTDTSPHYPSSYDLANIISVAMTDHNDDYDSLSNYGAVSVDLAAPGADVLSTLPGNSYGYGSGTSMATPHVAGVAALIRALSPGVPSTQIKTLILGSVDDITDPSKPTLTNGRLNAFFAIAEPDDIPPAPITDLATTDPTSNTMGLTWTATGDDGTEGTATFYEVRYSTDPIDDTNWDLATLAPHAAPTRRARLCPRRRPTRRRPPSRTAC
jgi:subtilisin family serine protease